MYAQCLEVLGEPLEEHAECTQAGKQHWDKGHDEGGEDMSANDGYTTRADLARIYGRTCLKALQPSCTALETIIDCHESVLSRGECMSTAPSINHDHNSAWTLF